MKRALAESVASPTPTHSFSRQERTIREAVFVSYARTGLAKSGRGGFNVTPAMTMAAHAISGAVAKSGVDPEAVEDVALGNGAHGAGNLGRLAGLLAGLPVTTGGNTIQRHCSSGLNSIAVAANYIKVDGADCVVAGGVESISIPSPGMGGSINMDPKLQEMYPAVYMAMIETADIVAQRYHVSARVPGRVFVHLPDADGSCPGERTVRRRDRPHGHQDEARRP